MSNKALISIVWVIGVAVVVSAAYGMADVLRWLVRWGEFQNR